MADILEGDVYRSENGEIRVDHVAAGQIYFVSWPAGAEAGTGAPKQMAAETFRVTLETHEMTLVNVGRIATLTAERDAAGRELLATIERSAATCETLRAERDAALARLADARRSRLTLTAEERGGLFDARAAIGWQRSQYLPGSVEEKRWAAAWGVVDRIFNDAPLAGARTVTAADVERWAVNCLRDPFMSYGSAVRAILADLGIEVTP